MKRPITIWICTILAFGAMTIILEPGIAGNDIIEETPMYTTHAPIRIDSDADFIPANGVTGGSGTDADPWIIEGWDIDGAGYSSGIYIGNTTDYFVIRNCSVHDVDGPIRSHPYYFEFGIGLYNVENGYIQNNNLTMNYCGIYFSDSTNNTVEGNTATQNQGGLATYSGSDENLIISNKFSANDKNPVESGYGIIFMSSSNNKIRDNLIQDEEFGIYTSGQSHIISNNTIENCSHTGLYIRGFASKINVRNNTFKNNLNGTMINVTAEYTLFYHNNFINNTNQAIDFDYTSVWNLSYPGGGNYWSDYSGIDQKYGTAQDLNGHDGLGDTPYSIDGGTGAQDNYPLMWPTDFVDENPPSTNLTIGTPIFYENATYYNYTWVNISTPFTFDTDDVAGVNSTIMRLWHYGWTNWTEYNGSFNLSAFADEIDDFICGTYYLEWYSVDVLGNIEAAQNQSLNLDMLAPQTACDTYQVWVNPNTDIILDSWDLWIPGAWCGEGSGVNITYYRVWDGVWSNWMEYSTPFNFDGEEGTRHVEFYSIDNLGHVEDVQNETFIFDKTLPTMISTSPTDGMVEVNPNSDIVITLSEAFGNFDFTISPSVGDIVWNWSVDLTTYTAYISSPMGLNTTYHVTLSNVIDRAGNELVGGYSFSFTTWVDSDTDGEPDSTDPDDDNDGTQDADDEFPLDPTEDSDFDGDGIGDNSDPDDDEDGVDDTEDAFPYDASEQYDYDDDLIGDNADLDDDNDGEPDVTDLFPNNPFEWADADGDGIGDNEDPDDDNDGILDVDEDNPLPPPPEEYEKNYPLLILLLFVIAACIYVIMFSKP